MLSTMIERREHFHFSVLAEAMTQNATRTQERIAMLMAVCAMVPPIRLSPSAALMSLAAQVRRKPMCPLFRRLLDRRRRLIISLSAIVLLKRPRRTAAPVEAH